MYIINDILDYTKIESGKIELNIRSFRIEDCVNEVVSLSAHKYAPKQLKLSYNIAEDVPISIHSDRVRIQQILYNLLDNAIKFTMQGGIEIRVLKSTNKVNELIFEIEDTGIGIPKEKQPKLFEAFKQMDDSSTRQYGGVGIGLALCQSLAKVLDGTIELESELSKGTIARLKLPFQQKTQNAIILPKALSKTSLLLADNYPAEILVAEDNKFNSILLEKILIRLGYKPKFAIDGQEAIEQARKHRFDLIFMDLNMPKVSGLEACRYILDEHDYPISIVAITANVQAVVKQECFAIGMKDFISKPFSIDEIEGAIKAYAPQSIPQS